MNYSDSMALIDSLRRGDLDFTKVAELLTIDEYRSGIVIHLSHRNITHFTDGWKLIFKTLLTLDLQELFVLAGFCLRDRTFANEFIASDMFPEFLKQAVNCSPLLACPHRCFSELKNIKGDDWFVDEIYVPNAHNESKWMDIMRILGLDPENEKVKSEVIPRIFNILKSRKNVNWPLVVTSNFASKSRQFCDDNIHWLPVILRCLSLETGDAVEECLGLFCENTSNAKLIPAIKKLAEKYDFYSLSVGLIVKFIQAAGSLDMFKRDELEYLIEDIDIDLEQYEPIEESSESVSNNDSLRGYHDTWEGEQFEDVIDIDTLILFVALCNDKKEYERLYPRMAKHFLMLDNEILCEFALKSFGEEFKKKMLVELTNYPPNWITQHPKLVPYLIN